jgi:phosphatidylglycerophosphatase C
VTAAVANQIVIVAFDFDGTLTNRDSVVPFLWRFARRRVAVARIVRAFPSVLVAVVHRDRSALRRIATRATLSNIPVTDLEAESHWFAQRLLASRMRQDTASRLAWHRARGHRIVFVSASYEAYLLPIAKVLGVEAVLATRLKTDRSRCTGELDGEVCRRSEKVARLNEWISSQGLERSGVTVWAYGDSSGDDQLLAMADHPVRVSRHLDNVSRST